MGGDKRARAAARRIDAEARARFLEAVGAGASLAEAARVAGCTLAGLYSARHRDPAFRAQWALARAQGEEQEGGRRCSAQVKADRADRAPVRITSGNGRRVQLRRMRHVRFTEARKRLFLAHFAGTCDAKAAAQAAGVDISTVYKHRLRDPVFAEEWDEALAQGYARLEAEAVRQRIEAQERLREGLLPAGEISTEFERVLKLLAQWKRKDGRIGMREIAPGRQKRWSFHDTMVLIEKKLRALNIPIVGDEPDAQLEIDDAALPALPAPPRHEEE